MIYIDKDTLKRVNIYYTYKGFSRLDTPEIRERAGVIEIPEPTPPADYSEELYYRTEQDDAPYVVFTKKSDEQIAAIRWQKIKQKRDELTINGGCKVGDNWFHSDTHSKVQQLALVSAGTNLPAGIQWKAMGGAFVQMTPELAAALFVAQMTQEQAIFAHAEALKADPTADITVGWPETYIESQP